MVSNKVKSRAEILIILIVLLVLSHLFTHFMNSSESLNKFNISVPYDIKCFFGEDRCWEGDIDIWSVFQFIAFFIIGYLVPEQYLFVFIITFIYEIIKPSFGMKSKIIINPLINITAYSLGSIISPKKKRYLQEKYKEILE